MSGNRSTPRTLYGELHGVGESELESALKNTVSDSSSNRKTRLRPTPPSSLEQKFLNAWLARKLRGVDLIREYHFHPVRKFRLDFAIPPLLIGIELDGFGLGHQAIAAFSNNHLKQNLAVEMGWSILRHTSRTLGSKAKIEEAIDQLWYLIQRKQT